MCQFCTANLINDIIVMFLLSVLESNITLLYLTFIAVVWYEFDTINT